MEYLNTQTWKEINQTQESFENIIKNCDEKIKSVAQKIKDFKPAHIVLTGRGTSNHALLFFKYLCEIYTPYVISLSSPSVITRYGGNIDYNNCVVIGCSQSGKAQDCIAVLEKAKKQEALTVAITNDEQSPMAKKVNEHICLFAGEEKSVAATKTFNAQLFVLSRLAAYLSNDEYLLQILNALPKKYQTVFESVDKATSLFAPELIDEKSGFILSRGITFPIALESALKLQETCYLQMKGYAQSDFYHGPMAMVSESTPIVFYCAKHHGRKIYGEFFQDQIEGIDKIGSLGKKLFLVTTDENIYEKYHNELTTFYIPQIEDELTSSFAFALFAQMLACKLSCLLEKNPDEPRALKKVTITR